MRLPSHRGSFRGPRHLLGPMAALNSFSLILVVLLLLSTVVAIALAWRNA